jgi:hypothetical protein
MSRAYSTEQTAGAMRAVSATPCIHPAERADREAIIDLLCRTFDRDPMVNYIVRNDDKRASGLRAFFGMWFDLRDLSQGEVMTTEGHRGASMWTRSERLAVGVIDRIRLTPPFIRCVGLARMPRLIRFFYAMEDAHPREPHIYAQFVGIDEAARGSGLASAFLQHVVQIADACSRPIYAETSNPDNLPIWAKGGLHECGTIDLGSGVPRVWQLWRPAAGQERS